MLNTYRYLDSKIAQLIKSPESANGFDCWAYFDIKQWKILLEHSPLFFSKALEYVNGAIVYYSLRFDEFNANTFESFSIEEWREALAFDSRFSKYFSNWRDFTPEDWTYYLLYPQPNLYKYCDDLNKVEPWALINVFTKYDEAVNSFSNWGNLNSDEWNILLGKNTLLIDKAKRYRSGWISVLFKFPEKIDECPYLKDLTLDEWKDILMMSPELSSRFSNWNLFSNSQWLDLLHEQPQLAEYYPNKSLPIEFAGKVLFSQPQLLEYFNEVFEDAKNNTRKFRQLK